MGGVRGEKGGERVDGLGTKKRTKFRRGRGKCDAACISFFFVSQIQTGKSFLSRASLSVPIPVMYPLSGSSKKIVNGHAPKQKKEEERNH